MYKSINQLNNLWSFPRLQKRNLIVIALITIPFSQLTSHNTRGLVSETRTGLINGDFEYGDLTGWTTGTGTSEAHVRIKNDSTGGFYVYAGTYGLALISYNMETYVYTDAWIEQELITPVKVGVNTKFSFWAKFYSNHIVRVTVTYSDGTNSIEDFTESFGNWHEYLYSDLSLNKEITKIRIERIGGGNISMTTAVDDISVGEGNEVTSTPQPTEISEALINGDFEYGDLTGWTTGTGTSEAHVRIKNDSTGGFYVYAGTYGLALISYNMETYVYTDAWIEQELITPVKVDVNTKLSFWARFYSNHIVRVTVTYSDLTTSSHDLVASYGGWLKYSVDDLILSRRIIKIRIERIGGGNTASTTAIDHISLRFTSSGSTQIPLLTPGFTILNIFLSVLVIKTIKDVKKKERLHKMKR